MGRHKAKSEASSSEAESDWSTPSGLTTMTSGSQKTITNAFQDLIKGKITQDQVMKKTLISLANQASNTFLGIDLRKTFQEPSKPLTSSDSEGAGEKRPKSPKQKSRSKERRHSKHEAKLTKAKRPTPREQRHKEDRTLRRGPRKQHREHRHEHRNTLSSTDETSTDSDALTVSTHAYSAYNRRKRRDRSKKDESKARRHRSPSESAKKPKIYVTITSEVIPPKERTSKHHDSGKANRKHRDLHSEYRKSSLVSSSSAWSDATYDVDRPRKQPNDEYIPEDWEVSEPKKRVVYISSPPSYESTETYIPEKKVRYVLDKPRDYQEGPHKTSSEIVVIQHRTGSENKKPIGRRFFESYLRNF